MVLYSTEDPYSSTRSAGSRWQAVKTFTGAWCQYSTSDPKHASQKKISDLLIWSSEEIFKRQRFFVSLPTSSLTRTLQTVLDHRSKKQDLATKQPDSKVVLEECLSAELLLPDFSHWNPICDSQVYLCKSPPRACRGIRWSLCIRYGKWQQSCYHMPTSLATESYWTIAFLPEEVFWLLEKDKPGYYGGLGPLPQVLS